MGPSCTEDGNQLLTPKELAWPAGSKVECADIHSLLWMEVVHTHANLTPSSQVYSLLWPEAHLGHCSSPPDEKTYAPPALLQSYIWQSMTWSIFSCLLAKEGSLNRSDSLQGEFYDSERKQPGFGLRGTMAEEQRHLAHPPHSLICLWRGQRMHLLKRCHLIGMQGEAEGE